MKVCRKWHKRDRYSIQYILLNNQRSMLTLSLKHVIQIDWLWNYVLFCQYSHREKLLFSKLLNHFSHYLVIFFLDLTSHINNNSKNIVVWEDLSFGDHGSVENFYYFLINMFSTFSLKKKKWKKLPRRREQVTRNLLITIKIGSLSPRLCFNRVTIFHHQ